VLRGPAPARPHHHLDPETSLLGPNELILPSARPRANRSLPHFCPRSFAGKVRKGAIRADPKIGCMTVGQVQPIPLMSFSPETAATCPTVILRAAENPGFNPESIRRRSSPGLREVVEHPA
jgi:hypothetical protein